ncbi:MAG: LPXTG cell wall anchor domain-containing protein [Lachnospiraceae bacterium]|nr:LPXTG cell wall anchor domain-containing protein [Lachnospiraceae bacterium]
MRKRIITSVVSALVLLLMFAGTAKAAFQYEHDPMQNPDAAADIIVNPDAVYGYSPNPEGSLRGYAVYDWSDPELVAAGKKDREEYHASVQELYDKLHEMQEAGYEIEEIARAISTRRNEIRLEAYKDDPEGLEIVKKRNLEKYGNEIGPTPEYLFEHYGSWETVIKKAFSSNPGMDACLGLYDEMYDTYLIPDEAEEETEEETIPVPAEEETVPVENDIPKTGDNNELAAALVLLVLSASILGAGLFFGRKITKE